MHSIESSSLVCLVLATCTGALYVVIVSDALSFNRFSAYNNSVIDSVLSDFEMHAAFCWQHFLLPSNASSQMGFGLFGVGVGELGGGLLLTVED